MLYVPGNLVEAVVLARTYENKGIEFNRRAVVIYGSLEFPSDHSGTPSDNEREMLARCTQGKLVNAGRERVTEDTSQLFQMMGIEVAQDIQLGLRRQDQAQQGAIRFVYDPGILRHLW